MPPQNASGALRAENAAKTMEKAEAAGDCPAARPPGRVDVEAAGSAPAPFPGDK
ncbi:MAG: hypothetical protein ACREDC_09250 [Bradyrhizobium sp.]